MELKNDKETRFYIDLDLERNTIVGWGYDIRENLTQNLQNPLHQRVFISKGQFNQFEKAKERIELKQS